MVQGILRGRALWILAAALAISVFISGGAVRRYWIRRQELNRLEDRRTEMRHRVHEMEARRERAEHDEAYIETVARRELGLVGPNEIEFRFMKSTASADVSRFK
jgi:cell division protein FtsB